jgi:hypothetical protein
VVGIGYTAMDRASNNTVANNFERGGVIMDAKKEQETTVSFYGKKTYYLNRLIARKVPLKETVPDYRDYEAGDKTLSKNR